MRPVGTIEIKNSSSGYADLYAISLNDTHFDGLYSALRSAAVVKKQVRLWISDLPRDYFLSLQRIKVVDGKY